MDFEIRDKDVCGRIGAIRTKTGCFETPVLLPVVNPFALRGLSPSDLEKEFGCEAIITNAYLLWKHSAKESFERGVHKLLDFSKSIMTDSGAYQLLTYGDVGVEPREIVAFQENIGSDIAVILDVPTGGYEKRDRAVFTVDETIRRAKELGSIKRRDDILWVGPVQGGTYLDLVEHSAREMGKLGFDIYAIGSPTQIMESYRFDKLVDLVATAKFNLPIEKPVHLFGAGHPSIFSLAVALGCDMFDSASYVLYAKDDRYMTGSGTRRLGDLREKVCTCPACQRFELKEMLALPADERFTVVARHNLYLCLNEIRVIKQAIHEGRLWELVEVRARTHPRLLEGLKRLRKYRRQLEKYSPMVKPHAIFYAGPESLLRPEVTRHLMKMNRISAPLGTEILVILPEPDKKPFSKSKQQRKYRRIIREALGRGQLEKIHICTVSKFFGLIPMELDETYPLAQHEAPRTPDLESRKMISHSIKSYVRKHKYRAVLLHADHKVLGKCATDSILKLCVQLGIFALLTPREAIHPRSKQALDEFRHAIIEAQSHLDGE
ncbi:MAG: tRNA guanosine(15) transglycosylase TgtA [Promethearchaeati archaeon SRVP18_Atabeyarchaeia-1]